MPDNAVDVPKVEVTPPFLTQRKLDDSQLINLLYQQNQRMWNYISRLARSIQGMRELLEEGPLDADTLLGDAPSDFRLKDYGIMYTSNGSTAQGSLDTTPVKVTGFTTAGEALGVTVDPTNDQITVARPGIYNINFQISFSGSTSVQFIFEIYVSGTGTGYRLKRDMGTGGAVGSGSIFALLNLTAGQHVQVYVSVVSGTSKSITPSELQLKVNFQAEA